MPVSERNTWPTWKLRQTRSRLPTATRKRSACTAIAVAFTAPADVPVTTGNGLADRAGSRSATARNTPTWYAARAPPPGSTSPTLGGTEGCVSRSVLMKFYEA